MSTQLTINLDQTRSRAARDAGILKAVTNADAAIPGWSEKAYEMFKEWLSGWAVGHKFQVETFRVSAYARGLEKPPSDRSFTVVVKRAKKDKLIESAGLASTKSVTAHGCFSTVRQKL